MGSAAQLTPSLIIQGSDAMPRDPKGEKRPADVIGNAVHVMRIATGEIDQTETLPIEHARRSNSGCLVCTACGLIGADVRPDWSQHTTSLEAGPGYFRGK